MGEVFQRKRASEGFPWTGERMVTGVTGPIENEHLHRYFLARSLCRGKEVLDIASGEGYGTALLAQTAKKATGVELDAASVEFALRNYVAPNLKYLKGEATQIPVADASIDIVVSFETLEHFFDHELFFREIRRILKSDGFLIISTPDTEIYSGPGTPPNPFHRRELTRFEFLGELRHEFQSVSMFRQRAFTGSAIVLESSAISLSQPWIYEQRDADTFDAHVQLPRAPYLIAIASNAEVPSVSSSLYIQAENSAAINPELAIELERLRAVEAAVRDQAPLFNQMAVESEAARQEVARSAATIAALEAERDRFNAELERFGHAQAALTETSRIAVELTKEKEAALEEVSRRVLELTKEKEAALTETSRVAAELTKEKEAAVEEASRRMLELMKEKERALEEGRRFARELAKEKDDALTRSEMLNHQLKTSDLLVRQQALVVRRVQDDLVLQINQRQQANLALESEIATRRALEHELATLRGAYDTLRGTYDEICRLLIPVRLRKLAPQRLRNLLRPLKRALTHG